MSKNSVNNKPWQEIISFFKFLTKIRVKKHKAGTSFVNILITEILNIMKKLMYYIGIFLLAGFMMGQTAYAQTTTLTKKEKRHLEQLRKKKERTMQRQASRKYYLQLLEHKYFVFEADYLTGPGGASFILTPDINFMSVDGNRAVLQFGFEGAIGWNGLGGITVNGTLQGYQVLVGKKKNNINVTAQMIPAGPGLPPDITLNVSDDGTAQLYLQPAGSGPIILYGQIVSPKKANIFIGTSLF